MEHDDGFLPDSAPPAVSEATNQTAETGGEEMTRFPLGRPSLPSIGDFGEGYLFDQFDDVEAHSNMLLDPQVLRRTNPVEDRALMSGDDHHVDSSLMTGKNNVALPRHRNQDNSIVAAQKSSNAATDGNNQDPTSFQNLTTARLFGGGTWSDQEKKLLKDVIKQGPLLAPIFFDETAHCTSMDGERFIKLVTDVVQQLNSFHMDKGKSAVEESLFEEISVILDGKHDWLPTILRACLEHCLPHTITGSPESQQDARILVMEQFKCDVLRMKNSMSGIGESLPQLARQQLPPHIPIIPRPMWEWPMVQPVVGVSNAFNNGQKRPRCGSLFSKPE